MSFKALGHSPEKMHKSQPVTKAKGAKPVLSRLAVFKLDGFRRDWVNNKKVAVNTIELLVYSPAKRIYRINCLDILGERKGFKATFLEYV